MMPVLANPPGWSCRFFKPGDEAKILGLFNQVFSQLRSLTWWKWKFYEDHCISNKVFSHLAIAFETEEIVAQYAVVPLYLNFLGRKMLFCQSVDTMVHEAYRKRGLFVELADRCYDECVKNGIIGVYGFPNKNSLFGFLKNLHWRKIGICRKYRCRLGIRPITERLIKSRIANVAFKLSYMMTRVIKWFMTKKRLELQMGKRPVVMVSTTIPPQYEVLWHDVCKGEILSLWKDSEYLRWRYERNPENQFLFFSIMTEGYLSSMAVVNIGASDSIICDIFVKDKDVIEGKYLINFIKSYCLRLGKQALYFIGMDDGFFDDLFSDFKLVPDYRIHFCAKVFDPVSMLNNHFYHENNWSVTFGDTDAI